MFDNEGMFREWTSMLLERNDVSEVKDLTPEMVEEEIADTRGSIDNEKMWALGSSGRTAAMHSNNAEVMLEYIEYLETLLPPKCEMELVLAIYESPDELPERIVFRVPESMTMEELRTILVEERNKAQKEHLLDCIEDLFERVLDNTCARIGQKSNWKNLDLITLRGSERFWEMKA
jgi:hypothetical protein